MRDECANCGWPRSEHHYNGACYGLCGEYVARLSKQEDLMMAEQSCGNCDAFARNKDLQVKLGQPHQGWCRAKPPNLVQVMVQVNSKFAPEGQQLAPGWQGVFPPTSSDVWCREWHPRTSKHQERLPPSEEIIDVIAEPTEPLISAT